MGGWNASASSGAGFLKKEKLVEQLFSGSLSPGLTAVGVIMAGGHGTRFWPASRRDNPKQFLRLLDKPNQDSSTSLIQATARRLQKLTTKDGILVVTALAQRKLVMRDLPEAAILAEPTPRNTAPCLGYAATVVLQRVGDIPMVCLPADHYIKGVDKLQAVLLRAVNLANKEALLITIGIKPTSPETGYGYIQVSENQPSLAEQSVGARPVRRFVEKPDLQTAKGYLASGNYFWNSGMFVWRPSVILAAINKHLPELSQKLSMVGGAIGSIEEYRRISEVFQDIEPVSIDYGVMEAADNATVISGDEFIWSDIGSWSAWADCLIGCGLGEEKGNIQRGDSLLIDSRNTALAASERLIVGIGLEDLIVVDTPDALLVCRKDRAQDVKKVVQWLKDNNRDSLL